MADMSPFLELLQTWDVLQVDYLQVAKKTQIRTQITRHN
jgi:hypothetical protein